uniref:Glycosyl transferase group 1 n=1 Tax=Geobacter sp. (strain M21) TaxID=443144 RepID=C6E0L3_GEOSM
MINNKTVIALLGNSFIGWGGGIDFLRFCANALALICKGNNTRIVILLPDPENCTLIIKTRAFLSACKQIAIAILERRKPISRRHKPFFKKQLTDSFQNIEGNVEILFYPQGKNIASVVVSIQADVVIPCAFSLGSSFPVPWVGYLYDFQHKYFPDYFSDKEINTRDALFSQMLGEASAVIVNAADVKKDIQKFYPQTKCKVFDLPFSATPIESWFEPASEDLSQKYDLPRIYFVMCNQFWIHKDHATAFKALAIYMEATGQQDVHIVCTGSTVDFRHPDYFSNLKNYVNTLGLTDRVHFLGHIPKKDQIDIMCGSIAVLQPTLFEGGPGGFAVFDAISLAIPVILSDIPVNREIEGYNGLLFFKAGDADDMAAKMIAIQNFTHVKQGKELLLTTGRERTKTFGLRLLEAAEYAMNQQN